MAGTALIGSHEVEYGLDLPVESYPVDRASESPRVLLVANPTEDLAAADAEGDLVAGAVRTWGLTRLDRRAATRDALLKALPQVGLFHFAGHAEVGGPTAATMALVMAEGARAQLGDLLALRRLPDVVVLSACQAAAAVSKSDSSYSTMGLAQGFLAAGARSVIAPTRDVTDGDAHDFMATLYRAVRLQGLASLAGNFRRAAIEAVGRSSQSFRLVVR